MTKPNPSCTNCTHQCVCSIYGYAVEYNKINRATFKPSSMVEVCNHYLRRTIFKEKVMKNGYIKGKRD